MNKVLIVDDHLVVREGLKLLIETNDNYIIIGEAENGKKAVYLTDELKPDIILMDLYMPEMSGLEAIKHIKEKHSIPIIILTTYNEDHLMIEGIELGAKGYLLKDTSSETLFHTMDAAVRGEVLLQPDILKRFQEIQLERMKKPSSDTQLTEKEIVVLKAIAKGFKSKAIAFDLGISERTVKSRLTSIYNKLGADSRTEAVAIAMQRGILTLDI
ncbi:MULTISPECIES: response regulator [Bacillus]|uniref:Response regulator transcription factor n=1 Tax=Bacillus halotolerans TaxID=260554 RepID=A0ABY7I0I9_9BACI|nr:MULTISPECIES: response regulator transcription factor [Bacillus]BDG82311.1 transcriptional regulatory protein YdfI [Bacillus subtilis]KUP31491.1 two-component system response regulator [Bacillus halotolerans]KUP36701.1 two-component system response regulator [Bacillus halotolerans]MBL4978675.1 response regulator transcription factor [Bacillus halotolerans]MBV5121477.1 response regulator transcription factor [Bacillus halotolerans]